jgi:hypothetical protein
MEMKYLALVIISMDFGDNAQVLTAERSGEKETRV